MLVEVILYHLVHELSLRLVKICTSDHIIGVYQMGKILRFQSDHKDVLMLHQLCQVSEWFKVASAKLDCLFQLERPLFLAETFHHGTMG